MRRASASSGLVSGTAELITTRGESEVPLRIAATVAALCSKNTRTPSRRRRSSTALSRGSEPLTA